MENEFPPERSTDTLELTDWVRVGGGRLVRREYLDDDHPESWPSQWEKKFGTSIYDDIGSDWRDEITD